MEHIMAHILFLTTILFVSCNIAQSAKPIPISPQDFTIKACKSSSNVQACETIVSSIIGGIPHDVELDSSRVALATAEAVQGRYHEVALALNDLIEANSKDERLKAALSSCYKMYMDIGHETRMTTMHLRQESEVCKARDFSTSLGANPKVCEDSLVLAGTTGEKLGIYKSYNDLQQLADACDSVTSYLIEANHFKTTDCGKN